MRVASDAARLLSEFLCRRAPTPVNRFVAWTVVTAVAGTVVSILTYLVKRNEPTVSDMLAVACMCTHTKPFVLQDWLYGYRIARHEVYTLIRGLGTMSECASLSIAIPRQINSFSLV